MVGLVIASLVFPPQAFGQVAAPAEAIEGEELAPAEQAYQDQSAEAQTGIGTGKPSVPESRDTEESEGYIQEYIATPTRDEKLALSRLNYETRENIGFSPQTVRKQEAQLLKW